MNRLLPLSLLFLTILSPILSAQTSSTSPCPCTFHGTVVDSVTGLPIRNALVEASLGSPTVTLTDSEGSFHFDGLPAGSISITAIKPGFLGHRLSAISAPSVFQVGPDTPPALLKLIPGGIVSGRIADDRGEPLEGFRVQLVRRASGTGDLFLFNFNPKEILTNDLGVFRIPDLPAGSYLLLVSPPKAQTYTAPAGETPLGYPRVYYPGVFDSASATPIKVSAGRESRANLTLTPKPAIRLSGTVSGYSSGSAVELSLTTTFQHPDSIPANFDSRTGSFQTGWIPPGAYSLFAQSSDPQAPDDPNAIRFAHQSLTATTSLSGINLSLLPNVIIPVRVHGLPPDASQIMIYAHPKGTGVGGQATGLPRELGSSNIECCMLSLAPGAAYRFEATSFMSESFYVESATFGSANLLTEDLIIDSSAARSAIEVVFSKGAATLSGTVSVKDSSHGALVALFPSGARSIPAFRFAETNGSFKFDHLAPGAYRVIALDGLNEPDTSNQELLKKLSAAGKEISLAPEQSLFLTLDVSPVEE